MKKFNELKEYSEMQHNDVRYKINEQKMYVTKKIEILKKKNPKRNSRAQELNK